MPSENKRSIVGKWVELYSDSMYSWARFRTSQHEVAEDLVQDTFIAALNNLDKYEGYSNPKTWLFSILNHKIMDYHRQNSSRSEFSRNADPVSLFNENGTWKMEAMPQPWEEEETNLLDNPEFRLLLEKCLHVLPANWFSIVTLKYLEEKKSEAICQDLGISITNLWQVIHRSKLQLRKCIELNWFKK